MEEKNEKKPGMLSDDELEKATGGISLDELQNVPIGARVRIVRGLFADQCGTIKEFQLDWGDSKHPKYYSWVRLDSGKETTFTAEDFELI